MGIRKPEQKLWDRLSGIMAGHWKADRVENKILQGMPDVYFAISAQLLGWVELKVLPEWPKWEKTAVKLPHYTSWQANWHWSHRAHGTKSWIFVQCGDELIVLPNRMAIALFEGMTQREYRTAGVVVDMQKMTNLAIVDALLRAR